MAPLAHASPIRDPTMSQIRPKRVAAELKVQLSIPLRRDRSAGRNGRLRRGLPGTANPRGLRRRRPAMAGGPEAGRAPHELRMRLGCGRRVRWGCTEVRSDGKVAQGARATERARANVALCLAPLRTCGRDPCHDKWLCVKTHASTWRAHASCAHTHTYLSRGAHTHTHTVLERANASPGGNGMSATVMQWHVQRTTALRLA